MKLKYISKAIESLLFIFFYFYFLNHYFLYILYFSNIYSKVKFTKKWGMGCWSLIL